MLLFPTPPSPPSHFTADLYVFDTLLFVVVYGLTEATTATHANPTTSFRSETVGVAVPSMDFKVYFLHTVLFIFLQVFTHHNVDFILKGYYNS